LARFAAAWESSDLSDELDAEDEAAVAAATAADGAPWVLRDLPLWRVQWVALPGFLMRYHVHVPHYCHMFEGLITMRDADAGSASIAATGRFGHLLLPGGSASLGTDAARLEFDGAAAPVIGALMEVREVERLADGKLEILAQAVRAV